MAARIVPTMPDWTSRQLTTSALLEQITTYVRFWANPPMFRMYQSIAQSIPNNAFTQLTLDTPDYDTDSGRSGISPYSYTIPAGMTGRWRFTIKNSLAVNATGMRLGQLYKNGVGLPQPQKFEVPNGSFPGQVLITVTIPVSAGDVMAAYVWQNITGGGALNTDTTTPSYFEGQLVSLATP
jgi:hypothetical protein